MFSVMVTVRSRVMVMVKLKSGASHYGMFFGKKSTRCYFSSIVRLQLLICLHETCSKCIFRSINVVWWFFFEKKCVFDFFWHPNIYISPKKAHILHIHTIDKRLVFFWENIYVGVSKKSKNTFFSKKNHQTAARAHIFIWNMFHVKMLRVGEVI